MAIFITISVSADGLVTNTNLSAAWVRLPARNASVNIDAVYYNPAGLIKLKNGFHVSVSDQSIFLKSKITNDYGGPGGTSGLNEHTFAGTLTTPLFPSIYAVYKAGRIAFSSGFNIIGGNGSFLFDHGLPSFEMGPSDLVHLLSDSQEATGYRLNSYFKGSSSFLCSQGGLSFKVNNWLSVAAGIHYVTARKTFQGYIYDIDLNITTGWTRADMMMTGLSNSSFNDVTFINGLVTSGISSLTFLQAQNVGYLTPLQRAYFENSLISLGYPANTSIELAGEVFNKAAAEYKANAALLADQNVDVIQTGSGIAPFFSVDIFPADMLRIGIRYEMATKLKLKNMTVKDFTIAFETDQVSLLPDMNKPVTMFPNGAITRNDLPAMLAIGVDYTYSGALKLSFGLNYFFDKSADYGHKIDGAFVSNKEIIDYNGMSLQAGFEYNVYDKFLVSGGYVWSNKGVNNKYQSDLSYGLASHTFGAGGAYSFSDKFQFNLGAGYTIYNKDTVTGNHTFSYTGENIPFSESNEKSTFILGIGLDITF